MSVPAIWTWPLVLTLSVAAPAASQTSEAPWMEPADASSDADTDAPAAPPTPRPEPTPDPGPATGPVTSLAPDASDALAACLADRARLAVFTSDLSARLGAAQDTCTARIDSRLGPVEDDLALCTQEVAQQERTNITLNDRLLACETAPRSDPDRIAELEAEVARLTERLTNAGLGPTPDFGYAGGTVWSSFVPENELLRVQGSLPKLPAQDCAAALDWLGAQSGVDRAIQMVLWVWQDETPQFCRRNADGAPGLAPGRAQDEAHVVIFR
ncbi:MAG: hypothetical protein AAGF79_06110 [Pseudomonadota bacterium]